MTMRSLVWKALQTLAITTVYNCSMLYFGVGRSATKRFGSDKQNTSSVPTKTQWCRRFLFHAPRYKNKGTSPLCERQWSKAACSCCQRCPDWRDRVARSEELCTAGRTLPRRRPQVTTPDLELFNIRMCHSKIHCIKNTNFLCYVI